MKKEKRGLEAFRQQQLLRCPICAGNGQWNDNGSFICQNNHCFDLAAKGYLNCLTNSGQRKTLYDKELFAARSRIFDAGFYQPVLDAVCQQAAAYRQEAGRGLVIADVGCGEGYYAAALAAQGHNVFALDTAKEAIQMACNRSSQVKWLVANLAAVPLQDGCTDMVLDLLTPANYQEFRRLLKPGGVVLKLIPGAAYLQEIRSSLAQQLARPVYDHRDTVSAFQQKLHQTAAIPICYTRPVSRQQAADFYRMTPMTFHHQNEEPPQDWFTEITIDLLLLVGVKRG